MIKKKKKIINENKIRENARRIDSTRLIKTRTSYSLKAKKQRFSNKKKKKKQERKRKVSSLRFFFLSSTNAQENAK